MQSRFRLAAEWPPTASVAREDGHASVAPVGDALFPNMPRKFRGMSDD